MLMEKIKAVQIVKPEELRVIEMDMPRIDEKNNVLVRIRAAGLCGSDVGIYHGTNAAATYPRVIGHEMVGEVVETGPSARKVRVGDRVIIDQVTACGHCYACRHNRPNVCQHLAVRGVHIDGGVGVGRVTREGLDQPVGAAAINSTPRRMIREQVESVLEGVPGFAGGLLVTISIPAGVELAAKTFNPRLGIEGGISVLGTGGIVRPMSEDALIASIELEMRMLYERGVRDLLVVPGNYGRDFACGQLALSMDEAVSCSNYFGATLDAACVLGFKRVLIVGHIGKMAKVAGGIMNTHSRVADCRVEVLAAHAALVGAPQEVVAQIMDAATTDAALDALKERGLDQPTMASLMRNLADKLNHRVAGRLQVEAIVFSNVHGVLGKTPGAEALANTWC